MPSSSSPFVRRLTRRWRRAIDALPAFPLPTPRRIASWWRHHRHEFALFNFQRFPSRAEIASWWRAKRYEDTLPALPRPPSAKEISKWYHKVTNENAPDLIPSPTTLVTSFLEQSRRRRRNVLIIAATLIVLGVGGRFAGPPAIRAVKGWHARRLAAQASELMDQQKWPDALKKLSSALQLAPMEPDSWRVYARFLSRTGQGAAAVAWWQRVAQSRSLSIDDRRDYAGAALSSSELAIASEQSESLLAQEGGPTPRDLLLAGQLAAIRGYNATAVSFAERILADARADSRERFGANLLILANLVPAAPAYAAASAQMLTIARDEKDPSAVLALAILGRQKSFSASRFPATPPEQRPPARLSGTSDDPLSIAMPDLPDEVISFQEIADRLDRNPNSRPSHRMLALELRAQAEPQRENEFVTRALQTFGTGDDETLVALSSWLYRRRQFEAMLRILPVERAVRRRGLLIERMDALAALNRYEDVKELLLNEHPVLEAPFEHMYLAIVRSRLGETQAVANEWQRALDAADSPASLLALAEYAEKMDALDTAEAAYSRLVAKQPGLRSGYLARLRLAQSQGKTAEAHSIASEIVRLWPDDTATHVRELYLRVLLDSSGAGAAAAETEAEQLVASNPWDGTARTALALSRLREGKSAAALNALTEFRPSVPSAAISVAVYAAALNANGWKEKAQEQAQLLSGKEKVLPEEKELVRGIRP